MLHDHKLVLEQSLLDYVPPQKGGHYIDATYGRGGITSLYLPYNIGSMIAFDRDEEAVQHAQQHYKTYSNFTIIHDVFSNMLHHIHQQEYYDAIFFDLGVSSPQLDHADRGFSFMREGPLHMGMGLNHETAYDIINFYSAEELHSIFVQYGDVKKAGLFVKAIIAQRQKQLFQTTTELANFIAEITPRMKQKHHPATTIFQALRIKVNNELQEIEKALKQTDKCLKIGGKLAVISFHSLEDKIVKLYFNHCTKPPSKTRMEAQLGITPMHHITYKLLHKKPITATEAEQKNNPRSRSAKLRVMQKIA